MRRDINLVGRNGRCAAIVGMTASGEELHCTMPALQADRFCSACRALIDDFHRRYPEKKAAV